MECECGSLDMFHDRIRGEIVCRDCGLVVMENIPTADACYVRFTGSDHSEPLGLAPRNPLNPVKVKTHGERRLEEIYHELKHKPVVQDIKDRALWVAKKYLRREGRLPIHSIEDFVDALVYLVSRERGMVYRPSVPIKTVLRVKRSLVLAGVAVWGRTSDPEYYLNKIVPQLGLGQDVKKRCVELLNGMNCFTPATRAATSVVLVLEEMGEESNLKEIAGCTGISPSTLWKALKKVKGDPVTEAEKERTRTGPPDTCMVEGYPLLERLNLALQHI